MRHTVKHLDQLNEEELNVLLNTREGTNRVVKLQDSVIADLKSNLQHIWLQIIDKEEAASRWITTLIILGLLQLYPFNTDVGAKVFLIATLPSFITAFFATALTLMKHPSYVITSDLVIEDADIRTRYKKNEGEIEILTNLHKSLYKNYQRKKKYAGLIGPSIIVNFTISIFLVAISIILGVTISNVLAILIAFTSIPIIFFLIQSGSKGSVNLESEIDVDNKDDA